MTTPLNAAVPASYLNGIVSIIASDATAGKVLVDTMAAAAASATSPLFFGGGSAIDIAASSTDTVTKDLVVWLGQAVTVVGAATGTAATTASTVTRTTGDFVVDGWKPGELVMMFNAFSAARQATDGVLGTLTAVAATTLTVNGAPFSALTLTTGVRICRMSNQFRAPIPANSGTNGTLPSVGLLNNTLDGGALRYEKKLAANELLAVSAATAVSALPAYISVAAEVARY